MRYDIRTYAHSVRGLLLLYVRHVRTHTHFLVFLHNVGVRSYITLLINNWIITTNKSVQWSAMLRICSYSFHSYFYFSSFNFFIFLWVFFPPLKSDLKKQFHSFSQFFNFTDFHDEFLPFFISARILFYVRSYSVMCEVFIRKDMKMDYCGCCSGVGFYILLKWNE